MNWKDIISHTRYPLAEERVAQFEAEIGCALPESYRKFLLAHNGGLVKVEHDLRIALEGYEENIHVYCLFALTLPESSPGLGVIELRTCWHMGKTGMKLALAIGNDGGTGYFFLMLSPKFHGQIYFCFQEEIRIDSPDWEAGVDSMPEYMGFVCSDFSELPRLILEGRTS